MSNFAIRGMSGIRSSSISSKTKTSNLDWDKIPHKGMKRQSEAEFKSTIDELAKELAQARYNNDDNKYDNLSSIADKVRAQYVSAVSPDRKNMVKDASELINQSSSNSGKTVANEPKNLFDFLNMKDGVDKFTTEGRFRATSSSGTAIVFNGSDLQPDTFEIKGSKLGQTVMGYATGNWYYVNTPQEQKMQQSFLSRLNSAEEMYYKQYLNSGLSNTSQGDNSTTSMKANGRVDYLV